MIRKPESDTEQMIIDCEQGSDEWYQVRLGKATGSCFSKVLAKDKKNKLLRGKTSKDYMVELAAERLTGLPQESFKNNAMLWGTEHEGEARAFYEAANDVSVLLVGFVQLNDDIGVSPDGLVDDDGVIEVKCPNSTTHIDTILKNKVPTQYRAQIQGALWVTGRKWCDYVSFDPRMKSRKYFCLRVERDQDYIDNLAEECTKFIKELEELTEKITAPF